ncbi:hypothetical protein ASPZODRAFT_133013 [Penicilliopsis zonata CBS 506.65]|uniref:Uncharacterized protein n=1 Tax=Penicilliopsis zonata CBS 506.65 TaxID=1073090 RepID=A0A1L9SFT8_9EURO|nr:hypothetical protein ASPZODRAFT_133013 [Penicilliopsis zonata CBS 506.65]OJJ46049.1 hypothetical protein ASPZODRAFT_133013 [Penicilliopsis zonata CBS 506.65]
MYSISRTFTSSSQATSDISSPRRQYVAARYVNRSRLQALLERLFPYHPGLNFHIRVRKSFPLHSDHKDNVSSPMARPETFTD